VVDLEITLNTNPNAFFAASTTRRKRAAILLHETAHYYWWKNFWRTTPKGKKVITSFNLAYQDMHGRGMLAPDENLRATSDSEGWWLQAVFFIDTVNIRQESAILGRRPGWIVEGAPGW
jgi:hypothetical protein